MKWCTSNPSHSSSFHPILKEAVNMFCVFLFVLSPSCHKCNLLLPQLFPKTTVSTLIEDWPLVLTPCRPLLPSWFCVLKLSALVLGSPPGDFYNTYFSQGLVTITGRCVHKEHHFAQTPRPHFFFFSLFICVCPSVLKSCTWHWAFWEDLGLKNCSCFYLDFESH